MWNGASYRGPATITHRNDPSTAVQVTLAVSDGSDDFWQGQVTDMARHPEWRIGETVLIELPDGNMSLAEVHDLADGSAELTGIVCF